jgi:putative transposase
LPNSYNKIWIHAVWSTKKRAPLILPSIENQVFNFINEQFREQGCPVRIINGMPDHVHCLFLLNPQKTITDVIKQIKGSSSFYINKNNLTTEKFAWQNGFGAFSVSESVLDKTFQYIKNQKQHHKNKSSSEELIEFLKLYGLTMDGNE